MWLLLLFNVITGSSDFSGLPTTACFRENTRLATACFQESTARTPEEIYRQWKKLLNNYSPVSFEIESSNGYKESTAWELLYVLRCLGANTTEKFLEEFNRFYKDIPQQKKVSASSLMMLCIMEDNPIEALKILTKALENCEENPDCIIRFANLDEKLEQLQPDGNMMKYLKTEEDREAFLLERLKACITANSAQSGPTE